MFVKNTQNYYQLQLYQHVFIILGFCEKSHTNQISMSDLRLDTAVIPVYFTSNDVSWRRIVRVVGGIGEFWEQNVLYLFWPDAKHLKAFSWLEAL